MRFILSRKNHRLRQLKDEIREAEETASNCDRHWGSFGFFGLFGAVLVVFCCFLGCCFLVLFFLLFAFFVALVLFWWVFWSVFECLGIFWCFFVFVQCIVDCFDVLVVFEVLLLQTLGEVVFVSGL